VADIDVAAQRSSNGESRKRRVFNASSGAEVVDPWSNGRSSDFVDRSDGQIARDSHGSMVVISEEEQGTSEKGDGQVGYQDFYMSLMDSASRKESRARYKKVRTTSPVDTHQSSADPKPSPPTLSYYSNNDRPEPKDERSTWEPNVSDIALFASDKPMKTAYNMFARSAHDAHRFPPRTRERCREVPLVHSSSLEPTSGTRQNCLEKPCRCSRMLFADRAVCQRSTYSRIARVSC